MQFSFLYLFAGFPKREGVSYKYIYIYTYLLAYSIGGLRSLNGAGD